MSRLGPRNVLPRARRRGRHVPGKGRLSGVPGPATLSRLRDGKQHHPGHLGRYLGEGPASVAPGKASVVSTGYGTAQHRALDALAACKTGLTLAELAEAINAQPRRCHAIVASLIDRGDVVMVAEDGARRAWLRTKRREWEDDRAWIAYLLRPFRDRRLGIRRCETCHQPIERARQ